MARLYIKRKDGGRGLISVEDCVKQEEAGLDYYVFATDERIMEMIAREVDYGRVKRIVQEEKRQREKYRLGRFMREMDKLATESSFQWIRGGYFAKSTEAFVFAAQEQALKTRLAQVMWGEDISPLYRACGKSSVWHIASGCKVLAQKEYRCRHDRMGLRI